MCSKPKIVNTSGFSYPKIVYTSRFSSPITVFSRVFSVFIDFHAFSDVYLAFLVFLIFWPEEKMVGGGRGEFFYLTITGDGIIPE